MVSTLILIVAGIFLMFACAEAETVSEAEDDFLPQPTPDETEIPELLIWRPVPGNTFQIQLTDYPPKTDLNVDIFEFDLFETPASMIETLHAMGRKVICYFNAGAWEDFRPDADAFPEGAIGNPYIGWPGERWLDIGSYTSFAHIMEARLDLAKKKGCDGVDPDNINGYRQPTGFSITPEDQLAYNIWLAEQAHARGLAIGMKNNGDQILELLQHFDFAVTEDCAVYEECANFRPFIENGKAIFQIEYTDHFKDIRALCEPKVSSRFFILLKNRSLDDFVQYCNE